MVHSDGCQPFGHSDVRCLLVFGHFYPAPSSEEVAAGRDEGADDPWLLGIMDNWQKADGWTGSGQPTVADCENVLADAARAVTEHLGAGPERTVASSPSIAAGSPLPHRIWRTPTHALILGPLSDHGPYGYLTHLALVHAPLDQNAPLPDADDTEGLIRWIVTHADW
ncbi:hypothetical protein [Streptomyces luteocolor]|uniref:hypothetical protein n=1 Tax=Streptomyces luteocolor TaxID=285500 RepID=UPI000AE2F877|nr:hypothetical protein [Streptomyces luteocolor]